MAFCGRSALRTSEARLSPVQLIILASLSRRPAHGYQILRDLKQQLPGWALKSGTIYPALHKLVEKGLIEGREVEQDERPDAIEYSLTEKGNRVLKEAFSGLSHEMRAQENLWHFLGSEMRGPARARLFDMSMKERSPMAFVFMRRQCKDGHCSKKHLTELAKYREYLEHELKWVKTQLKELKSSEK